MQNIIGKNWWEIFGSPEMGHYKFSEQPKDIAGQALLMQALQGGKPVHSLYAQGYFKDGKSGDDFDTMAKSMGFEPIMFFKNDTLYRANDSLMLVEPNDKPVTAKIITTNGEVAKLFLQKADEILEERHTSGVYVLVESGGGNLELKSVGQIRTELVRENYDPKVLEDIDYVAVNLGSNEPDGRLSILNGPPGTGKTHLIKGLINSVPQCDFIVIAPDLVRRIAGPQFISLFTHSSRKRVLILEDADGCLTRRAADTMSDIQAVLNLADGIIGQLLDFRIVATTNAKKPEFDEAILRPGRLCRQIEIGNLSPEQANAIYNRIMDTEAQPFEKDASLAEVYAKAKGRKAAPLPKLERVIGFNDNLAVKKAI